MAYQEVVAATNQDAINLIATFAASNGWTVDRNDLVGSNRTVTLHKSGDHIHIYNVDTINIRMRGSVGYTAGQPPASQPNVSTEAACNPLAGPYTRLYMFAGDAPAEHFFVVIETSNGIHCHLCFGMLEKLGAYTGGTFFDCSFWAREAGFVYQWSSRHHALFDYGTGTGLTAALVGGSIRCDIPEDSRTNAWARVSSASGAVYRVASGLNGGSFNSADQVSWLTTLAYARNDAPFSGQVMLGSIRLHASRTGGSEHWSPIGTVPNIRYLNMQRYSPGQEITIGSDIWKVFPMARWGVGVQITGDNNNVFSAYHGYAYKKVV